MKKGGEFEAVVKQEIRRAGLAIRKVDPPFRIIRYADSGRFIGCYESAGALDFAGCVSERHVEFDAKDIKGKRFDFSRIRDKQMAWADHLLSEMAEVGWLVRFRADDPNHDQIWYIPHEAVVAVMDDGRASINVKALPSLEADGMAYQLPPVLFGKHLAEIFRNFT